MCLALDFLFSSESISQLAGHKKAPCSYRTRGTGTQAIGCQEQQSFFVEKGQYLTKSKNSLDIDTKKCYTVPMKRKKALNRAFDFDLQTLGSFKSDNDT